MSTVGFQEIKALSGAGQVFTSFLIISSFGIFTYAVSTLTRYIIDGIFRHYFMDTKIKNRISKLKSAGAKNVIMPDRIGGQRMAKLVAHPDVIEFLDHIMLQPPDEVYIEEISCKNMDSYVAEKTIGE